MISKRPPKYYTVPELCEILDLSERYLRGSILPNVPEAHRDTSSRTHYYYGRAVMEAWRRRDKSSSPDELMVGDSPAIEKYRHIKFLREKLAYEESLRKLIPVEVINMVFTRIANQIHQSTIILRKQFGDRAAQIIEDCIEQIHEETNDLCVALETPTVEDTADGYNTDEFPIEGIEGPDTLVYGESESREETDDEGIR